MTTIKCCTNILHARAQTETLKKKPIFSLTCIEASMFTMRRFSWSWSLCESTFLARIVSFSIWNPQPLSHRVVKARIGLLQVCVLRYPCTPFIGSAQQNTIYRNPVHNASQKLACPSQFWWHCSSGTHPTFAYTSWNTISMSGHTACTIAILYMYKFANSMTICLVGLIHAASAKHVSFTLGQLIPNISL